MRCHCCCEMCYFQCCWNKCNWVRSVLVPTVQGNLYQNLPVWLCYFYEIQNMLVLERNVLSSDRIDEEARLIGLRLVWTRRTNWNSYGNCFFIISSSGPSPRLACALCEICVLLGYGWRRFTLIRLLFQNSFNDIAEEYWIVKFIPGVI